MALHASSISAQSLRGGVVPLQSVALQDEEEDAFLVVVTIGNSSLLHTLYFRKPADVWNLEWVVTDDSHHKVLAHGGATEDPKLKRQHIRKHLTQFLIRGNMLQEMFWIVLQPMVDEKTRKPLDQSDRLGNLVIEIQSWDTELVFYLQKHLGESYAARLSNRTPNQRYPRNIGDTVWALSWDKVTSNQAKIEEFLKELPEL